MIGRAILLGAMAVAAASGIVQAGMPAPLPTSWTKESGTPHWIDHASAPGAGLRWQALSFFAMCLLLSAWAVRGLWRVARKDFPSLPELTYRRSLAVVVLWGLLFVIVLTMISGARELMTPGAWKKQGWTYQLAADAAVPSDNRDQRRKALEKLRWALWQHAATHDGELPDRSSGAIDAEPWNIPSWPGLTFLSVAGRRAEPAGRLLAFEPELDGGERLVLLTNGTIGTMDSAAIKAALAEARSEAP